MKLSLWSRLDRRQKMAFGILILCCIGVSVGLNLFLPDAPTALRGYEQERVLLFQSDLAVTGDGTVLVSERIVVRSAGDKMKRGVVRTLPLSSPARRGSRAVGYELNTISLDGVLLRPPAPVPSPDWWQLFVGQADLEIEPGQHTFDVQYRAQGLIELSDLDEGFRASTGVWPSVVEQAVVAVRLPKFIDPTTVVAKGWLEFFSVEGAQARTVPASGEPKVTVEPGEHLEGPLVIFTAPRALSAGEYLVYEAYWPPGFVKQSIGVVSPRDTEISTPETRPPLE